jgi:hypothetical protein
VETLRGVVREQWENGEKVVKSGENLKFFTFFHFNFHHR